MTVAKGLCDMHYRRRLRGHKPLGTHIKHDANRRGQKTPLYRTWVSIKTRCFNPNAANYQYYGGRGITMCDEWRDSFEAFALAVGPKPDGTSIDRIDNDGNYQPGNVRWATHSEQMRNRRTS